MHFTIELPTRESQLELNRKRWSQVIADRGLSTLPFRIETNEYGQLLMTPPASGEHSSRQGRITILLDRFLGGHSLPECPISTIAGVRAIDIGWYTVDRYAQVKEQIAFELAPEICVEVLSPSNTDAEMRTKRTLYFEAGAEEVWICGTGGVMSFYHSSEPDTPVFHSKRCPSFPLEI
jgi:Uma2 family endonuclease